MVAPLEYSSGLNRTKTGSSTDLSIIPNSYVGLIGHGQPFARVEVRGSRISPKDNGVADGPSPKLDRCRFAESLLRGVALFLPFQSNNDRQRAAKAGTRRNRKSA